MCVCLSAAAPGCLPRGGGRGSMQLCVSGRARGGTDIDASAPASHLPVPRARRNQWKGGTGFGRGANEASAALGSPLAPAAGRPIPPTSNNNLSPFCAQPSFPRPLPPLSPSLLRLHLPTFSPLWQPPYFSSHSLRCVARCLPAPLPSGHARGEGLALTALSFPHTQVAADPRRIPLARARARGPLRRCRCLWARDAAPRGAVEASGSLGWRGACARGRHFCSPPPLDSSFPFTRAQPSHPSTQTQTHTHTHSRTPTP